MVILNFDRVFCYTRVMQLVKKLIDLFIPEHYDLSIELNRVDRSFSGTVTINGTVQPNATDVRFHAKDLEINSALFDGKEADFTLQADDELAVTHPDLSEGKHIFVIGFSGKITDNMNGIYPGYYEVNGEKQELLATQFESHYARQAFPVIDEPSAKATFDLTLTTEQNVNVLGNMPVKSQRSEDDKLITTFETTPRMSSYLLAWVVGNLQKKTASTKSGVEINIWSTLAHDSNNLDFALDIATRTIDFFDEFFGVPYPLPKSDHVALPDFSAGAMENWGLITYREIALLVDPETTSIATKQYVATVIAHELSHQWFGNLVTMEWWNDLWLNESFAEMMEFVAIDALEPEWNVWLEHASTSVLSALRRDALDGVQAIQTAVNHPDEISSVFDPSIVYAKGGRMLRMLQAHLGNENLRAGLKLYFEKHQYKNTSAQDLWDSLSKASGNDISSFMNAWMTQSGYPVVHASIDRTKVSLKQEQFFVGPHQPSDKLWPIPLHSSCKEAPVIMETATAEFEHTSDTPLTFNKNGTAHFITHYDEALMTRILAAIETMPVIDRLNLLHEQTLLAKAGIIPTAALIPLIQRYANETEESVWGIIGLAIGEMKLLVEANPEAEQKLRQLAGDVSKAQYERLGWESKEGEPENDTKLRPLVISLALYSKNPQAIETANSLYAERATKKLDSELRTSILANAVRQAKDSSVVDALLEEYVKVSNSELRDDIAAALTSTEKVEDIKRFSEAIKDSNVIRRQDFTHWLAWLIRNRYGRDFMLQWVQAEWSWIDEKFSNDPHYDMFPRYIASGLVTEAQLEQYRSFFTPLLSELALKRNIKLGITELEGRVELIKRESAAVQKALLEL
ncbi:MAG: aminopeptidase nonfunctional [Candidatus Saccharibacteria bacterium]|nr:aminopeptidase nonfunctional [Candidatus Saccharibacteria bacterium]